VVPSGSGLAVAVERDAPKEGASQVMRREESDKGGVGWGQGGLAR
jgi:hypothetical protein